MMTGISISLLSPPTSGVTFCVCDRKSLVVTLTPARSLSPPGLLSVREKKLSMSSDVVRGNTGSTSLTGPKSISSEDFANSGRGPNLFACLNAVNGSFKLEFISCGFLELPARSCDFKVFRAIFSVLICDCDGLEKPWETPLDV